MSEGGELEWEPKEEIKRSPFPIIIIVGLVCLVNVFLFMFQAEKRPLKNMSEETVHGLGCPAQCCVCVCCVISVLFFKTGFTEKQFVFYALVGAVFFLAEAIIEIINSRWTKHYGNVTIKGAAISSLLNMACFVGYLIAIAIHVWKKCRD